MYVTVAARNHCSSTR